MGKNPNTAEQIDPLFPFTDLESDGQEGSAGVKAIPDDSGGLSSSGLFDRMESLPSEKNESEPLPAESSPFLTSFILDLIPEVKKQLAAIRHVTSFSVHRLGEEAFRAAYQKNISEKIVQIDSVLNSLLNYIHINTPVFKKNTLHVILEEILEANEKQLREKKIRVFRKVEKELPDTYIHDEQMKYILNTLLQFVILSSPPNGSIGFLLRVPGVDQGEGQSRDITGTQDGMIEVLIGFNPDQLPEDSPESLPQSSKIRKDEITGLILKLAEEILKKNRGTLNWEVDGKRSKSLIIVKLPIERRKVVYYERINL